MLEIKPLADGQIPVSKTAVYTVPAGKKALIKCIRVCNVSLADHPFLVYYKKSGGTSRVQFWRTIQTQWTSEDELPFTMAAGDAIEMQSSDGATIFDYVIFGAEEVEIETA